MAPTVFLTQRPDLDTSDLLRFGAVRDVTTRSIYPDEADERTAYVAKWAWKMLGQDYRPNVDYIALGGDPLTSGIVMIVAFEVARLGDYDFIRILKWDKQSRAYYPVTLRLAHIGGLHANETDQSAPAQA